MVGFSFGEEKESDWKIKENLCVYIKCTKVCV